MKRLLVNFLRIAVVAAVIVLQLLLLIALAKGIRQNAVYVYAIIQLLAVVEIFLLIGSNKNPSYTMVWVLVIALLPVFGQFLYLLWGQSEKNDKQNARLNAAITHSLHSESEAELGPTIRSSAELEESFPQYRRLSAYLEGQGFPLYRAEDCRYFPLGELQFDAMIADMEKAERYIFLEYFILGTGKLWDRVSDVLYRKAAAGVEVRLLYDDLGSVTTAPAGLLRELNEKGVQAIYFNPIHQAIARLGINYRNHQKICVIDGHSAYTGGTNLADEYANYTHKYGHWKDTAICLQGAAAWGIARIFLQMWDAQSGEQTDYAAYWPARTAETKPDIPGYYQPFADGPHNNPANPAEMMYRQVITGAQKYVYITTPYLIIDSVMSELLCTAALSGVDVRLVTPKICDHWYVHWVTRSNYQALLEAGVKVYEYTPGYIHAKMVLSDDRQALIGSVNMDYRSFHLHFENAVWTCGSTLVEDIQSDMNDIFSVSEEVVLEEFMRRPLYVKAAEIILRPFAIMM